MQNGHGSRFLSTERMRKEVRFMGLVDGRGAKSTTYLALQRTKPNQHKAYPVRTTPFEAIGYL